MKFASNRERVMGVVIVSRTPRIHLKLLLDDNITPSPTANLFPFLSPCTLVGVFIAGLTSD